MGSNIDEKIGEWQQLVNKPVYTTDGKEVGIVRTIQPEHLVIEYGPVTRDKRYLIPKSSINNFDRGIVYLNKDAKFVDDNYKF
jgi:sporulation protein YlmC with PRC-barrel domain